MTDTTISDALVAPQDDGTGVPDGSEDFTSAAYFQALSKYQGYDSYVGEDNTGSATLQFSNVDTSNEQVDVNSGYAYINEGNHIVQSAGQSTYDTTLPIETPYVVILPSSVTGLGLGTDNVNDLWLAVDPTSNDSVYIRHGNGLSAPSDPSVKLGTVDTSNGDTTRANDLAQSEQDSITTQSFSTGEAAVTGPGRTLYRKHLTRTTDDTATSFSFTVPSEFDEFLVDYMIQDSGDTENVTLAFEGDSAGNGLYGYWDETGAKTTSADNIPLLTVGNGGFSETVGRVYIMNGLDKRPGVSHHPGPGFADRITGFATAGGRNNRTNVTQIDITTPALSDIEIDVWGLMKA